MGPDRTGGDTGVGTYQLLISLLETSRARYRLIEHPPEGRTELVSALRGHPVAMAAKCLIVMVKQSRHARRYYLAVVSGDAMVDLAALRTLAGGSYVALASKDKAEVLAGSPSGTVLPFAFHPELELVADPALLDHEELFFNAARLDRSIALATADYLRIAKPHLHPIAQSPAATSAAASPDPAGGRR